MTTRLSSPYARFPQRRYHRALLIAQQTGHSIDDCVGLLRYSAHYGLDPQRVLASAARNRLALPSAFSVALAVDMLSGGRGEEVSPC